MANPVGFQALQSAYECFLTGRTQQGFTHFQHASSASRTIETGTYGKMWEVKNRPLGNSEYGRHSFHNAHGLTSSAQEKAAAIAAYMIAKGVQPRTPAQTAAPLAAKSINVAAVSKCEGADFEGLCAALTGTATIVAAVATFLLVIAAVSPPSDPSETTACDWGSVNWGTGFNDS